MLLRNGSRVDVEALWEPSMSPLTFAVAPDHRRSQQLIFDAFAAYFTGQSYFAPLTDSSVPVSNVTFEPGRRNNWHIHHGEEGGGDQVLLCTAGSGWYQAEGEEPVSLEPGSVVRVPAGTKH